jgi:hypothetical protein
MGGRISPDFAMGSGGGWGSLGVEFPGSGGLARRVRPEVEGSVNGGDGFGRERRQRMGWSGTSLRSRWVPGGDRYSEVSIIRCMRWMRILMSFNGR